MRRLAALSLVLFLTAFAPTNLADGEARVEITGALDLAFDGHAYFVGFGDFSVLALSTLELADGDWSDPEGAYTLSHIMLNGALAPGTYTEGVQMDLGTHYASGEVAAIFTSYDSITLTIESATDALVVGTLRAELTGYLVSEDGVPNAEEKSATLAASFRAAPGQIPSP